MKKFIVIAFMALAVTMIAEVPAKASDVTPTEDPSPTPTAMPNPYSKLIVRSDGSVNMENVWNAYQNDLTSGQRELVCYLVGLSNYMYLSARGFKYNNISLSQDLQARLLTMGERFFGTVQQQFTSRLTPYMQQFLAACVSYAAQQEIEEGFLSNWIYDHSDDIYIPFTDNALAGWTAFYNDPSTLGVIDWGSYASDWESGSYYDFAYPGIVWYSSAHSDLYNSFILNQSPVLYTNTWVSGYDTRQYVYSFKDKPIIDSVYIQRGTTYQFFRWGNENGLINDFQLNLLELKHYERGSNNYISIPGTEISTYWYRNTIISSPSALTLDGLLSYAFNRTPFTYNDNVSGWYPYISHVFLVDDLNTLSNKVEIFNTNDLGINGDQAKWIQTPNGQVLYYPIGSGAILTEFPLPDLLQKDDGSGNLVPIDPDEDLVQSIVNNTVINNYNIVAPGSVINVPVNWLESDGNYLDYTNTTALPFFIMIGDIFNALGEIRIFIIAVLILGLAGGVLVKFLL